MKRSSKPKSSSSNAPPSTSTSTAASNSTTSSTSPTKQPIISPNPFPTTKIKSILKQEKTLPRYKPTAIDVINTFSGVFLSDIVNCASKRGTSSTVLTTRDIVRFFYEDPTKIDERYAFLLQTINAAPVEKMKRPRKPNATGSKKAVKTTSAAAKRPKKSSSNIDDVTGLNDNGEVLTGDKLGLGLGGNASLNASLISAGGVGGGEGEKRIFVDDDNYDDDDDDDDDDNANVNDEEDNAAINKLVSDYNGVDGEDGEDEDDIDAAGFAAFCETNKIRENSNSDDDEDDDDDEE